MANESLDDITIYSDSTLASTAISASSRTNPSTLLPPSSYRDINNVNIPIPYVLIHSQSSPHKQRYDIHNSSSIATAWPLGYSYTLSSDNTSTSSSNSSQDSIRVFFNNLIKIDFNLYFRSSSGKNKDYLWKWAVNYDASTAGQILVTAQVTAITNYAPLPQSSPFWVLSLLSLLTASVYWVLLMKALMRQLRLLARLLPANRRPAVDSNNNVTVVFRYGSRHSKATNADDDVSLSNVVSDNNGNNNDDDNQEEEEEDNDSLLLAAAPAPPPPPSSTALHTNSLSNDGGRGSESRNSQTQRSRSQHLLSLSSQLVQTQLQSASLSLLDLQSAIESLTWTERLSVINLWVIAATMACMVIVVYGGIVVMSKDGSERGDPLVSGALKVRNSHLLLLLLLLL